MPWYIIVLLVICTLIAAFITYILINALIAKNKRTVSDESRKNVNEETLNIYVSKLQKMLRCKTVYSEDNQYKDEFIKFQDVLKQEFPLLHKKGELKIFDGCLVYKVEGKNATKNILLMSHHDVVLDEGEWELPAFEAQIKDGSIYARGSIDTKTPLFAELQALEELLEENYEFDGFNVYIASSNSEEVGGPGIVLAKDYWLENNIHFDVILDEGGAIVEKQMPGVKNKSAMIAVHEKGRHSFKCVSKPLVSGHTGLNPVKDNPVERMSYFIKDVKKSKIFKKSFSKEVEELFINHAPYMPYALRILFSNFKIFRGLILFILPRVSPVIEAMLSTTMSFTKINTNDNKEVEAIAYFRCVRKETLEKELVEFNKIAKKYSIEVSADLVDYCTPSNSDMENYKLVKKVLNKNFPDVIVSPFLLTAGTDARRLWEVSDTILRFAPIDLDSKQYKSIHNPNEHIKINNVGECVLFYKDFIKEYKGQ